MHSPTVHRSMSGGCNCSKPPSCNDSEFMELLTIFQSQASLIEGTRCDDICCVDRGCRGAHTITPQICERIDTSLESEPLQHFTRQDSSQYTLDRIADLRERANMLLSRERSSPMRVHLNKEEIACRKKMIDWAMRVLRFGYSKPSSSKSSTPGSQQNSIEVISIVSIAFS